MWTAAAARSPRPRPASRFPKELFWRTMERRRRAPRASRHRHGIACGDRHTTAINGRRHPLPLSFLVRNGKLTNGRMPAPLTTVAKGNQPTVLSQRASFPARGLAGGTKKASSVAAAAAVPKLAKAVVANRSGPSRRQVGFSSLSSWIGSMFDCLSCLLNSGVRIELRAGRAADKKPKANPARTPVARQSMVKILP